MNILDDDDNPQHLRKQPWIVKAHNKRPTRPLDRKARFQRDLSHRSKLYVIDHDSMAGLDVGFESSVQAFKDLYDVVPFQGDDKVIVAASPEQLDLVGVDEAWSWMIVHPADIPQQCLLGELGLYGKPDTDGGLQNFQPAYDTAVNRLVEQGINFKDDPENLANKIIQYNAQQYDYIVIASGEEDFEVAVTVYQSIGIEVVVVSRLEVLSEGLANAANGVLPIPNLLERQEQLRLKRVLGFQSKNSKR
ncbi:uncharacterized protein METZ01_LOCUS375796 [marine metagenome]|uniref:NYN domain-containing protein n=1 Tax=marine metagenome TaxID=408172 RepID=A0A382TME5_9ZZZZ